MPPWRHPMSVGGDFINKPTRTFCSAQRAASSMCLRELTGATHNAKRHGLPWQAPPSRTFWAREATHARPQTKATLLLCDQAGHRNGDGGVW